MNRLFNLIRNENMKLYGRVTAWIMIILLILSIVVAGFTVKAMSYLKPSSLLYFLNTCSGFISLITLFTIIIGTNMVSAEFLEGTIKLLLIRPSKRWKILLSKYISTLLFSLIMTLILIVTSFAIGGILFGFNGISQPSLLSMQENSLGQIFRLFSYNYIELIIMVTLAFMLSIVFRTNSFPVGISIFLMFMGTPLVMLLGRYSWAKYILFANTNLNMYNSGTPLLEGMTLQFSITVLIVYYILFIAISWFSFVKRDVAA